MRTRSRIARTFAILSLSGTFLLAQHGGGSGGHASTGGSAAHAGGGSTAGAHSAGIGTNSAGIGIGSAGIGRSSIQPYRSAQSIGGGINLNRATPGYSGAYGSRYSGNSTPSTYGRNRPGPWRSNSRYGRYGYAPFYGLYAPYFSYLGTPYYGDYTSFGDQGNLGPYDSPGYQGNDPNFDPNGPPPDENGLGNQVAQLSDQLNDLRGRLDQPQQPPVPYRAGAPAEAAPVPPVSVVLNGGQTLQIQSYAIVGDTFWDFSSQPVRKIPLSSIDVPASTKASEASGAEFPQIKPGR